MVIGTKQEELKSLIEKDDRHFALELIENERLEKERILIELEKVLLQNIYIYIIIRKILEN